MSTKLEMLQKEPALTRVYDKLIENAQNSIRIETSCSNENEIECGMSKFGGLPDLPPDIRWPYGGSAPLSFIAQFNLFDIKEYDKQNYLPESGMLYFFYDGKNQPWGNADDFGNWKVIYSNHDNTQMIAREAPEQLSRDELYSPCKLIFHSELTLPPPYSPHTNEIGLDANEMDVYWDLMQRESYYENYHRLIGHPDQINDGMQYQCQYNFHGLKRELRPSIIKRALTGKNIMDYPYLVKRKMKQLDKHAGDWILLLQVDTDNDSHMMWGDAGTIYFWIQKDKLEVRNFDDVWIQLECT